MVKRKLPVGIQTFRRIREGGFYYVDKTGYIRRLLDDDGTHYFLSRPRRFGKSLFVDTLKELFEGSEELFRGLAVHDGWNWSRRHAVVGLSFGGGNYGRPGQCWRAWRSNWRTSNARPARPPPRELRRQAASPGCWRRCTVSPGGASWYWWTNTTSRSWTPWMMRRPPGTTATICAGCTARSRTVTPISSSHSSPG